MFWILLRERGGEREKREDGRITLSFKKNENYELSLFCNEIERRVILNSRAICGLIFAVFTREKNRFEHVFKRILYSTEVFLLSSNKILKHKSGLTLKDRKIAFFLRRCMIFVFVHEYHSSCINVWHLVLDSIFASRTKTVICRREFYIIHIDMYVSSNDTINSS